MSRSPRFSHRLSIAACSAALMASCAPSPIPAGYTYHRELYKSPPAPAADEIGYEFTVPANRKAVERWREVARDLVGRLESGYVFQGRDVALIPPLGVDQMNKSLDYAMHDAFADKGYRLRAYSPDIPGVSVTMHPLAGEEKAGHEKALASYAETHGFKPSEVTGVSIRIQVREGARLVHELRGIYSIPNFGYDPEFNRQKEYRLMPAVGLAPYRTEPELRPVPIRPAAPIRQAGEGDNAPADKASGTISKDDLDAPAVKDEANKPLDLQGPKD